MLPKTSRFEREKAQSERVSLGCFLSEGESAKFILVGTTPKPMPTHCHTCTPSPVRRPSPSRPAHYCAWPCSLTFEVTRPRSFRMSVDREGSRSSNERVNQCNSSNSRSQHQPWHSSQAASTPTPSAPLQAQLLVPSSLTLRAAAPRRAQSSAARQARSATTQASATNQNQHLAFGPYAFTTPLPARAGRGFVC